ncbi:unnamed protein product [Paramecium sonneborni]|uniref:EF-hand domain-containing protein n=1 Tax=Paramecium sonneborni TaxID=65129 RepID=A0A8S1PYE3_9CILI|nr:unnamed protein product [Paramecium sonneborni]
MATALVSAGQSIIGTYVQQDIETRLQQEVYKKQIRVREFFTDFDRLRKGWVTEDKFRSALSMINFHFTRDEIEEIIRRYKLNDGLVQYTTFCNKLEEQFLNNEAKAQVFQAPQIFNKEEEETVMRLMLAIKRKIATKRIFLKQPFQDFDRTACSHITIDQFSRVLNQLGLLPKDQYLQLLIRQYIDNGNPKEVNYVKFCDDVDNVQEMLSGVITGIKHNPKEVHPDDDFIEDKEGLDLISTLFTSKKLTDNINTLEQVLKKIQGDVVMKRIRIREFYKDFDPLRKGLITESQFARILHLQNIPVTEKEISILLNHYKIDKIPNGQVDYNQFCEDVDKIFTIKGIDKSPQAQVPQIDDTTTLPARRRYLQMTEQEAIQLDELLMKYKQAIQNKRVLLKPVFEDFDKTKQGYITTNQFLRILNQFNLFPDPVSLNLLLKRFVDKANLNEVNYYDFCRIVDQSDEGVAISKSHADAFKNYVKSDNVSQAFIRNDQPNDFEDLMAKLRRIIKEQRQRIAEFLRDFDKLRSGTITVTQLRKGLSMAKILLSDAEFQLILQNFGCKDKANFVYWKDFTDQVDQVFTTKNLEKVSPSEEVPMMSTQYNYGRVSITERDRQVAEVVQKKFQYFCKATRLDIKQFFQDWDKLGRNKVSPKQFRQTLATVNFILTDEEFQAVVKIYAAEDDGDIRYVQFINDTQPPLEIQTESGASQAYVGVKPKEKEKLQPSVLLEQIKVAVKIKRLRLGDYFKDFDPLRKGLMPTNKFRGVLSQMKIDLDQESLDLLETMYVVPEDPIRVNYAKFIEDVEIVFTKSGLDKDPLMKPPVHVIPTFLDPRDALTTEEEEALHAIMLRLGEVVKKHRILLKPHFQDKDKTKSGKITFTRFRSIMDFHKLPLTDDQFRVICKRFAYQGIEFNYVEFDEILKKYENFNQ